MSRKVIIVRKFATFTALIGFSFGVNAQTLGFDVDTLPGRYIADMLTYATVEVIDCPPEVSELPAYVEDYLCVEDVDNVPFTDDIDRYLKTWPSLVKENSGWHPVNSSMLQTIVMNSGYTFTLVTDPTTNIVMVLGDQVHYAQLYTPNFYHTSLTETRHPSC